MDEGDAARHYQESLNADALSERKPEPGLEFIGECHNCGLVVDDPQRFCDSDCSAEWESVQERRAGR